MTDYSSFVCSAVGNYQNMRGWWLRWERRFLGRTLRLCTLLLNLTEGLNLKTNEICRPYVTPADKFNPKTTTMWCYFNFRNVSARDVPIW